MDAGVAALLGAAEYLAQGLRAEEEPEHHEHFMAFPRAITAVVGLPVNGS